MLQIYAHTLALILVGASAETPTNASIDCRHSATWKEAREVFELHCHRCHGPTAVGTVARRATRHFDMSRVPFGSKQKDALKLILAVLEGQKPRMPPDGASLPRAHLKTLTEWAQCSETAWPSGDRAGPEATVGQFHAALSQADGLQAMSLLAPNVVTLRGDTMRNSRTEFMLYDLDAEMTFASATERTIVRQIVTVADATASVLSLYAVEGVLGDSQLSMKIRELVVLQRIKAHWTITHIHWVDLE